MAAVQKLVTQHLDLWATAIKRKSTAGRGSSSKVELYGIKKLRELILELAVRGLLVSQDPNDEPASGLLERIVAERSLLAKEGKIKKDKPLVLIGDEEKPFALPKGWIWVRNANLYGLRKGKVPKDISDVGEIPYLDIEALDRGNVRRYTNDVSVPRAKVGDLLVVCDGSRSGLVLDGKDGAIGSTLSVAVTPKFIRPFVKLLFMHGFERLNSTMKGAAIPHLDTVKLLSEITGLPPFSEQHRIVTKVDEVMALCDQLEKQTDASIGAHQTLVATLLTTLTRAADHAQFASCWQRIAEHFDTLFITEESIDQLKQTILQLAVMGKLVPQDPNDEPASELLKKIAAEKAKLVKEGKIRNPKPLPQITEEERFFALPSGWVYCRLQEIVSILGDGLHGTPSYDDNGDYHFINGNNLSDGKIIIKPDTKRVGLAEYEKHRKELNGSTVLVSINGTIGNVAFFNNEQVILGKSACYFNLLSGVEKSFIKRFIEAPIFLHYAASQATGSTISNLGLKAMNALSIPLPPTSEQMRIIAKVDELFSLCDELKARLSDAQFTQLHLADALAEQALVEA